MYLRTEVQNVDTQTGGAKFRAFSGTIKGNGSLNEEISHQMLEGCQIIGITDLEQLAEGTVIDDHAVTRAVLAPANANIHVNNLVNNLLDLSRALLCQSLHLRALENEVAVLVAGSMDPVVPYIQWILLSDAKAAVYLPKSGPDSTPTVVEDDYKHGLFEHPRFKSLVVNVIIRRCQVDYLAEDVLKMTNGLGASAIAILPGAKEAFGAEEAQLNRQAILAAGMGARIVWQQVLEQMDPCECKCLFSKGISLGFYNFDATLESHCADGIVQHSLLEIVKRAINNELYIKK